MKISASIFLILLTLSCAENKTSNKKNPEQHNNKTTLPKFEFDTESHNFGKLTSGEILSYSFLFTNSGNTNLIIEKAEADCGCLKISIPQKTIAPGKKGIIEVQFNAGGMIGRQLKTVELHSNCADPKHLIIFADVENEQIEIKY